MLACGKITSSVGSVTSLLQKNDNHLEKQWSTKWNDMRTKLALSFERAVFVSAIKTFLKKEMLWLEYIR